MRRIKGKQSPDEEEMIAGAKGDLNLDGLKFKSVEPPKGQARCLRVRRIWLAASRAV